MQYFESIDHLFATLDAMSTADLERVRAPAVAMAMPMRAAARTAQVSLAMRAYESGCIRPHIWATAEALLARLFAPIASDDDRQAERTDRPMPTFEDALARHHGLSLPDPEPPCTREAMFDVEVADWTPRNRTIELWFTRANLEPVRTP